MAFHFIRLLRAALAGVAFLVLGSAACAHGVSKGDLVLDHPYATPTLASLRQTSFLQERATVGEKHKRLAHRTHRVQMNSFRSNFACASL
jgi:hypothetical protein